MKVSDGIDPEEFRLLCKEAVHLICVERTTASDPVKMERLKVVLDRIEEIKPRVYWTEICKEARGAE